MTMFQKVDRQKHVYIEEQDNKMDNIRVVSRCVDRGMCNDDAGG